MYVLLLATGLNRAATLLHGSKTEHSHELAIPPHALSKVAPESVWIYGWSSRGIPWSRFYVIKDLKHRISEAKRTLVQNGDAELVPTLMREKVGIDPDFFCKFSVDEEDSFGKYVLEGRGMPCRLWYFWGKLTAPIWQMCIRSHWCVFIGNDNHQSIVVFGFALLMNETAESYSWVLWTFLESMNDKMSVSIVTDGFEVMRFAIDEVFVGARHRLYAWHIGKNVP